MSLLLANIKALGQLTFEWILLTKELNAFSCPIIFLKYVDQTDHIIQPHVKLQYMLARSYLP